MGGCWFGKQVANSWWTLGPSVSLPIFDGGRRKAQLRQAKDQFDEASATYRSTVLSAFQQVEDSLAGVRILSQQMDQQKAAAASAQQALDLEMERYKSGIDPYIDVVTAQNTLLVDQQALTDVKNSFSK